MLGAGSSCAEVAFPMRAVSRPWRTPAREERRSSAADELRTPGCAACRSVNWSADRWLGGFVYEHHTNPVVLASLVASGGFCPAHTRSLIALEGGHRAIPFSYHTVLEAAVTHLEDDWFTPSSPCPLFCLPHAIAGLGASGPRTAQIIVETLQTQLAALSGIGDSVQRLAGADADVSYRRQLRATLGAWPSDRRLTVRQEIRALLRHHACPLCLAVGRGEALHLRWLATELRGQPERIVHEIAWICGPHLHDLAVSEPAAAEAGRVLENLDLLPGGGLRERCRAASRARALRQSDPRHESPAISVYSLLVRGRRSLTKRATRPASDVCSALAWTCSAGSSRRPAAKRVGRPATSRKAMKLRHGFGPQPHWTAASFWALRLPGPAREVSPEKHAPMARQPGWRDLLRVTVLSGRRTRPRRRALRRCAVTGCTWRSGRCDWHCRS